MMKSARIRTTICAADPAFVDKVARKLPEDLFEVFGVVSFARALKILTEIEMPLILADQVLQGGRAIDLFDGLGAIPAGQTRLLLHRFGEPIPQRSQNHRLVYHDILPYPAPSEDLVKSIERWRVDASSVPDLRALSGASGRRVREVPPEPGERGPSLAEVSIASALPLDRQTSNPATFCREVFWRLKQLEKVDYWTLLGLERGASNREITEAFDLASRRFHPDRNRRVAHERCRRGLSRLYAVMSEAYDVLSDPERATRYVAALSRGELRLSSAKLNSSRLDEFSTVLEAKRFLRLAETSLHEENRESALQSLRCALGADPENLEIEERIEELSLLISHKKSP